MPWDLYRLHQSGQNHFITFSCFRRQAFFGDSRSKRIFETVLESMRRLYQFRIYGYVVMPEHVHLLMSEPDRQTVATAIQCLKQAVSRRCTKAPKPFWGTRYNDHNVGDHEELVDTLRYIHRNPVKRGLCHEPEDWRWSSSWHYATGEEGIVEIESYWTAQCRERDRAASQERLPPWQQKLGWGTTISPLSPTTR